MATLGLAFVWFLPLGLATHDLAIINIFGFATVKKWIGHALPIHALLKIDCDQWATMFGTSMAGTA